MKNMIKRLTIIWGIVLLTEILSGYFFSNITFINGSLTITNRFIGYFAFSAFALYLLLLFKMNRVIVILSSVLLSVIFLINSYTEIFPIETTTQPVYISTLQIDKDGNKLIVQEFMNAETNEIIRDTVLVKDYFILRRIINRKSNKK